MPSMQMELNVEMENGSTFVVVADQRDIAKWEVQSFGGPFTEFESRAMTGMRFLAWSAATRQGLTDLKWDDFDAQCVEAAPLDEEGKGIPEDAEDPGNPVQSGSRS